MARPVRADVTYNECREIVAQHSFVLSARTPCRLRLREDTSDLAYSCVRQLSKFHADLAIRFGGDQWQTLRGKKGQTEAGNVILTYPVKASDLKTWALGVARRAGPRKAKVALARKLAVVLHRMFGDQPDFHRYQNDRAVRGRGLNQKESKLAFGCRTATVRRRPSIWQIQADRRHPRGFDVVQHRPPHLNSIP